LISLEGKMKGSMNSTLITCAATVAVAVPALIAIKDLIPKKLFILLIVLLVVAIFLLVFVGLFGEVIYKLYKEKVENWRYNSLTRKFHNRFEGLLTDFNEFVNDASYYNIAKELTKMCENYHFNIPLSQNVLSNFTSIFHFFKDRKLPIKNYKEFFKTAGEFTEIVKFYNKVFIHLPLLELERNKNKFIGDPDYEYVLRKWSKIETQYTNFIKKLEEFNKEMNGKFQDCKSYINLCAEYEKIEI